MLEDGTVLIYSMFGTFKSSFSMGQEAKDIKILGARFKLLIFNLIRLQIRIPIRIRIQDLPFWIPVRILNTDPDPGSRLKIFKNFKNLLLDTFTIQLLL